MFGQNPIRPPVSGDGMLLDVQQLFATLQGEGPFVGQPSVFVRLGGCNLACGFCDTEFEDFTALRIADIIARVEELSCNKEARRVRDLVVITGGEPLRQNIAPLCERLIADGFRVQVETNGTLFRELPKEVAIVCSPKNKGDGYHAIRLDLMERLQALKFIVSAHDYHYRDIAEVGQKHHKVPVYVQPMDEQDEAKNAANVAYATQLAIENGYILSLQTHKMLGIE